MSLQDAFDLSPARKVRYAVVGLGDIAQEAMLPGIEHTGNSEVVAFVTSDPVKAERVGKQYGVTASYGYDRFDELLRSGTIDAIYLAMPNWRHAEFAIPALRAGIHVLVEKPLEISVSRAREIVDAERLSTARVMVAYRLHFEPSSLALLDTIRSGELGDVHLFTSTFCQMLDPENHRAKNGDLAGPVFDMGPYPVNAARNVFGAEPTTVVSAVGTRHPGSGLGDFDDTVAVTLAFPGGRLAQFAIGYYGNAVDSYYVLGTKGYVLMDPAYLYGAPLERTIAIGKEKRHEKFKNVDHFGGEMKYFSACILDGTDPEPDAEEGLADVRVLEGILAALKSGAAVELEPFERRKHIVPAAQKETLGARKSPELVNVSNPGKGTEKIPKN